MPMIILIQNYMMIFSIYKIKYIGDLIYVNYIIKITIII